MKSFNGKAIYNPSGKAGEYSYWACNFYTGCSNGCTYCYLKKGRGAKYLGGDKPQLKKCFKNETHALEVFEKELKQNFSELQKHGLFFTFTSDPFLPETWDLTWKAVRICNDNNIPVKLLTKRSERINSFIEWIEKSNSDNASREWRKIIAFGFTLTGHDELEPNASPNAKRIEAMKQLHDAGFKTFASIEPIIDFERSLAMIAGTQGFCDLYKTGLESGKKFDKTNAKLFLKAVLQFEGKFYFKDTFLKLIDISRDELPENCVGRDYNLFNCH